jgi:cell division protein FtsA
MSQKGEIIAGLDVGTTKICLLVGERTGNDELRVLGVSSQPSSGLRKGEVVNVDRTVESIQKTLAQVEDTCELKIGSVYVGITGAHVESFNSRAILPIGNPAAGVTRKDMTGAVAAASRVSLPPDREIMHVLAQEYSVDDRAGIIEPEGIQGSRLEANVHLVTARTPAIDDIVNCVRQAGLDVAETVLQQLASSLAVMRDEEQESGAVLVDIGGGTTDYAFFRSSAVRHTRVISVGGDHVTNDISLGMKLLLGQAEELKRKAASALADRGGEDQVLSLPSALVRSSGGPSRKKLCWIVELRMTELFRLIRRDLERAGLFQNIGTGLVLTGGGALLKDIALLAERETGLPVRIGLPRGVCGLREVIDSPVYSTAVGLVKYGLKWGQTQSALPDPAGGFLAGIRRWLGRYF